MGARAYASSGKRVDPLPCGDEPCAVHDDEPVAAEVLPLWFVVPV